MRIRIFLLLSIFLFINVSAQTLSAIEIEKNGSLEFEQQAQMVHVTDVINATSEARQSLQRFHELKRKGLFTKNAMVVALGDTVNFKVGEIKNGTYSNFANKAFRLEATGDAANLWVSLDALKSSCSVGCVTPELVQTMKKAMLEETPEGSIDPTKGIIALDNQVFGEPPNSDGDGKVDILWYDVRDSYDGEAVLVFTGGFVSSADLLGGSNGNNKDILHIDTHPSLTFGGADYIGLVGAHEYQHLIHFNYDFDEDSFVNEGLSEWASVMTGYPDRTINYLIQDLNNYLFSFRKGSNDVIYDYQRAGLFTTYLADQLGAMNMGAITQMPANGAQGYTNVLNNLGTGLTLSDVILNYHTANVFNNASIDARYGYTTDARKDIKAPILVAYEGLEGSETPETKTERIQVGGVDYVQWKDVEDFNFSVDVIVDAGGTQAFLRQQIRILTILEKDDGSYGFEEVILGNEPPQFFGKYKSITFVFAHINPNKGNSATVELEYSASWKTNASVIAQTIQYDDGKYIRSATQPIVISITEEGIQATKFTIPENTKSLHRVEANILYENQFSGEDDTKPRNFRLHVWEDDGSGAPGNELFFLDVEDTRPHNILLSSDTNLPLLDIPLDAYASELSNLPSVIYIGFSNTGTDDNYLLSSFSTYSEANTSFLKLPSIFGEDWVPLWSLQLSSGTSLRNTTFPIRAQFLVNVIVSNETEELPKQVTLSANYPNPFNPTTTISYELPQSSNVQLQVFDVLGRLIETFVNEVQTAGKYNISVNAESWSSGVYFYTLTTEKQTITKKMMLVR